MRTFIASIKARKKRKELHFFANTETALPIVFAGSTLPLPDFFLDPPDHCAHAKSRREGGIGSMQPRDTFDIHWHLSVREIVTQRTPEEVAMPTTHFSR